MRDRRFAWVLVPGIVVGLIFRFWNLPGQIMSGDELHAPQVALSSSLGEILTTYHAADNCLPLTALFKLWLLAGGRLSEAVLRAPALAASLVMLVVLPWLVKLALRGPVALESASSSGRRLAGWFALLLAVSPPLVLYGRIARPYAPATLLAWVALLGLLLWRNMQPRFGGLRWTVLAGAATGLAVWFHPLTAPFLATAYGLIALDLAVTLRRSPRALAKALARMSVPPAVALGILVGPALHSLAGVAGQNIEAGAKLEPPTSDAWLFFAGTPTWLRALPFCVMAACGLVCLWRRCRRLAALTFLTLVGQFVGMVLLHPIGLSVPLFLGRYLLFALPGPLLWIACSLEFVARPRGEAKRTGGDALRLLAGVGLVVVLVACGPLLSASYRKSSFVHHNDWLQIVGFAPRVSVEDFSPLYRELPDDAVLLEIPASKIWPNFLAVPHLQLVHERPVLVASFHASIFDGPQVVMRNWLSSDPEAWLASRATLAILHRDPAAEELVAGSKPPRRIPASDAGRKRREAVIEALGARWGPPFYSDERVVAFDLDRARAMSSAR